ncbi:hypothetical protein JCM8547_002021 [Rhodosporidiobolus lusitaniae]
MDSHYLADHPSPFKKRRVSPPAAFPSSSSSQQLFSLPALPVQTYAQSAAPPLSPLPAPLALLALASSLRSHALSLLPSLAKRPSSASHSSNLRYATTWAAYVQALTACVTALRAAGEVCRGSGEWRGGRVELRANAMRAEVLVEMYEKDEKAIGKVAGEVEEALAIALSIAQSHPSLQPYTPSLSLLQLRLSLATSKPLKYLRQLHKKLLSSLPSPSSSSTPVHAAAYYAAQSLWATVDPLKYPEVSETERRAVWRSVADTAQQRGDEDVRLVSVLAEARLALEAEDYGSTSALLCPVASALQAEEGRGRTVLATLWRIMKTVVLAQTGHVKEAKEYLKGTHRLLDLPVVAGSAGATGVYPVPLTSSSPTSPLPSASLSFLLPPHSHLYPFTFHLSTSLHLDPLGRSPRSLLFGEEGLRILSLRLNAREASSSPVRAPGEVKEQLRRMASVKVSLAVGMARLRTMRGEFADAEKYLEEALRTAQGWGLWDGSVCPDEEAKQRREEVVLAWGLNRLARGVGGRGGEDEGEAEKCFEAVIASTGGGKEEKGGGGLSGQRRHGRRMAMLSLVVMRISQGGFAAVVGSSSGSSGRVGSGTTAMGRTGSKHSPSPALPSPSPSASPYPPSHSLSLSLSLTPTSLLISSLTAPSPSLSSTSSSWDALLTSLALSLTSREITSMKTHLSAALTVSNGLVAHFVRAGVLGVLGVVFGWTRDREALKMLQSAYKLATQMGPSTRLVTLPSSSSTSSTASTSTSTSTSSIFPGAPAVPAVKTEAEEGKKVQVQVGNARLQLWVGERLLETYRLNPTSTAPALVKEQERANEACRVWLRGLEEG